MNLGGGGVGRRLENSFTCGSIQQTGNMQYISRVTTPILDLLNLSK